MFDPEKVERFTAQDYLEIITGNDKPLVRASDYDQLLRLRREEMRALDWMKTAVGAETFETLMMTAKAEINSAYECGDLK